MLNENRKTKDQYFKVFFEQSGSCCMILDPNTPDGIPVIIDANKIAYETHGYTRDEFIGRPIADVDDEEGKKMCFERTQHILSGKPLRIENIHVRKDGTTFPVMIYADRVDIKGEPPLIFTTEHDISTRKQMEDDLKHMATHDSLTGLYNRRVLEERLNDEVIRATRYNHPLSVFMLDIDHFKPINDRYGHHIGDSILQDFSKVLEGSIRNSDYAARYGGEEFIIILPETSLSKAEEMAERLRKQIEENSFSIEGNKNHKLTTSIGIATFPEHAQTDQDLLEAADSAMYTAKKAGRNQVKKP